jgi:hypothetical protein
MIPKSQRDYPQLPSTSDGQTHHQRRFQFPEALMKTLELPSPHEMPAVERAGEIATILAAAIVRTLAPAPLPQSAVGLGFFPDQSVHTTPYQKETLR